MTLNRAKSAQVMATVTTAVRRDLMPLCSDWDRLVSFPPSPKRTVKVLLVPSDSLRCIVDFTSADSALHLLFYSLPRSPVAKYCPKDSHLVGVVTQFCLAVIHLRISRHFVKDTLMRQKQKSYPRDFSAQWRKVRRYVTQCILAYTSFFLPVVWI